MEFWKKFDARAAIKYTRIAGGNPAIFMSIVTKTGDQGETARFGGGRVSKNDASVIANGDVDELNSAIGLLSARSDISGDILDDLKAIQSACFTIGAELATPPNASEESRLYIPRIKEQDLSYIEARINHMEPKLAPQKHFLLPGGTPAAAMAYWIRTIARRAERSVVIVHQEQGANPMLVQYLNRLSDYFYVLARYLNQETGVSEKIWQGGEGSVPRQ
ncbi:MAG: cob(I)yrinic acid a,c-diamide adenosyltransferase [Patescibacteria group bacterium]|nr:cob(I)yrinic acid a,c-diamide adenosyltransferase [Patescibacteria group bacterium]MDP6756433.1 cob(I)yrinic acid a,c-diamide adenosyltransferase [Patescibacteria group bacterium]